MLRFLCVLVALGSAWALTDEEVKQFHNSGSHGGNVTVVTQNDRHIIYSNGLPDHPTQKVNPNHAGKQHDHFIIRTNPTFAQTPGCLPMGPIGITRTGVAIYDLYTAEMEDAVKVEHFDRCDGHADPQNVYHYHKIPSSCMYKGNEDEFIGVALDGFPIYGPKASDLGREVTSADLDACHGRMVNGKYRYHVTTGFPYYLGCFKGTILVVNNTHGGRHPMVPGENPTIQYNCDTSNFKPGMYVCSCPHRGPPPQSGSQQSGNQQSGQQTGNQQFGQQGGNQQLWPFNGRTNMPQPTGTHQQPPQQYQGTLPPRPTHHPYPTGRFGEPLRPWQIHHLPPNPFGKK